MARSEKDRALLFFGLRVRDGICLSGRFYFVRLSSGRAFWPVPQGVLCMKSKGLPCHFARQDVDPFFMNRLF